MPPCSILAFAYASTSFSKLSHGRSHSSHARPSVPFSASPLRPSLRPFELARAPWSTFISLSCIPDCLGGRFSWAASFHLFYGYYSHTASGNLCFVNQARNGMTERPIMSIILRRVSDQSNNVETPQHSYESVTSKSVPDTAIHVSPHVLGTASFSRDIVRPE